MARTTPLGRKVFNHLYEELSLLKGELAPRMELWDAVGELFDPVSLTKGQAEAYLCYLSIHAADLLPEIPERKIRRMLKKFDRWDPEADTPDEVMERICGGFLHRD
jgi:hypothetical protein